MTAEAPIDGRLLVWQIEPTSGFDTAWAALAQGALHAEGFATALTPQPYWLSYELETDEAGVTRRLAVASRWDRGTAALELRRDDAGWKANGEPRPDLAGALDVDVAACPLFNSLPVLRHRLLDRQEDHQLLMAFVAVPELTVTPSGQHYTHLRPSPGGGAIIRYRSGDFSSDLRFDADGYVVDYPQLGRRVEPSA